MERCLAELEGDEGDGLEGDEVNWRDEAAPAVPLDDDVADEAVLPAPLDDVEPDEAVPDAPLDDEVAEDEVAEDEVAEVDDRLQSILYRRRQSAEAAAKEAKEAKLAKPAEKMKGLFSMTKQAAEAAAKKTKQATEAAVNKTKQATEAAVNKTKQATEAVVNKTKQEAEAVAQRAGRAGRSLGSGVDALAAQARRVSGVSSIDEGWPTNRSEADYEGEEEEERAHSDKQERSLPLPPVVFLQHSAWRFAIQPGFGLGIAIEKGIPREVGTNVIVIVERCRDIAHVRLRDQILLRREQARVVDAVWDRVGYRDFWLGVAGCVR
jgi:hypothetical protein